MKDQHGKFFKKFLEMFKNLEINITFSEGLDQMPIYAKFMKDIISKEHTIAIKPILLTETCSAILQDMKISVKKKHGGSITIPCTIGDGNFKKELIDLGTSVSLMPLSIYRKLGVEDVLVKIDNFMFLVDFVILEMSEDEEIPLILGIPFLKTGRCMINIEEESMTLKVYDEEIKFDVRNAMK
ncbi:hypothetical protein KIW84_052125 [Lathyrus oleraceus]|uniref:Aspartic peptidase DDI1-type domain-containing protein n=1 Tax=Pisum sativum TaxID=3888 RepID=A0A9D4WPH5_PEA|nr:hypothetical protein KIW84_052125 [Pisum sativum]